MKNFKSDDPLEIEKLRHKYTKEGSLIQFRKLYSTNLVKIPNMNVGGVWDVLNKKTKMCLERSPIYKNKTNIILKFLCQKQGNLLDVGFGSGFIEKKLCNTNLKLFGIDISRESVSNLNNEAKGVFKIGTVLKIPFKSNYFDFVLLLDVLEHISFDKTFEALRELDRVLKKEGYLIISVPLNEGLKNLLKAGHNPNMHVREYTPEILKLELKLYDFCIEKEYSLYAFERYYLIKKILTKIFFKAFKKANLYIVIARKI